MSNSHEGVSCDNCMKSNFSGKRYKCLICYDFDLCSSCYDQSQSQLNPANNSSQDTSIDSKSRKSSKQQPPISNSIQINQSSHLPTHAMQCILTRSDHELFYGSGGAGIICDFTIGGAMGNEQQSFTCPYCGKCGFSETTLCKHLSSQHSSSTTTTSSGTSGTGINNKREVVCPICAVLPNSNGGDPNHLTDNLLQHINLEHVINSNKNANKNLDDTLNDIGIGSLNGSSSTNSSNAAAAAAAALRFSRRLNYSNNTSRSSLASQSGITIGNSSGRVSNGSSINRYAFQFGQSNSSGGGLSNANALSSFMRSTSSGTGAGLESLGSALSNQMDPIAELLSQLTGVRRAVTSTNSTNNQLQQLQQQLSRERESLHQSSNAGGSGSGSAGNQGSSSSRHHHLNHHLFSGVGLGANLTKSQLLNSITSSKSNNQNSANSQNAANQAIQTANSMTSAFSNQVLELPPNYLFTQSTIPRDPRHLLSKYDFNNGENQAQNSDLNQINQSIFINDMLVSILLKQLTTNEPNTSQPTSSGEPSETNANSAHPNSTSVAAASFDNNFIHMASNQDEDLAEELLRNPLDSVPDMCTGGKSKTVNTIPSSEETKFMEL